MIDSQTTDGYESSSRFQDTFSKLTVDISPQSGQNRILEAAWFDTKLGPMIAVADENALYLLEFGDTYQRIERQIARLRKKTNAVIVPGRTAPIDQIETELNDYFVGTLHEFKTPIRYLGTALQERVWNALTAIPYGETRTYTQLAITVGKPDAVRAVGQANGANPFAILVPCHRLIRSDGGLAGYGGGLARKRWLIQHERSTV